MKQVSIVRAGNYFVRVGSKWALVEGPWYDYLNRMAHPGAREVRLPHDVWQIRMEPRNCEWGGRFMWRVWKREKVGWGFYPRKIHEVWVFEDGRLPASLNESAGDYCRARGLTDAPKGYGVE